MDNTLRLNLLENQKRGMLGERIAMDDYLENGFNICSTTIGSDFIAYKYVDGKKYEEYVEVKTGKARQSITQKRKMREMKRLGITYTVYRVTEKFLSYYLSINEDYWKNEPEVDQLQKNKLQFNQSLVNVPRLAASELHYSTDNKMFKEQNAFSSGMVPHGPLQHTESISEKVMKYRINCPKPTETTMSAIQSGGNLNV